MNVMVEIDTLYAKLDHDNRNEFKKLFRGRYKEMYLFCKDKEPQDDTIDELAEMYFAGLLTEPNDATLYAYDTEVYRKRDRAKEAIRAAVGKVKKQIELDKAIRYWSRMTTWYTDIVSDGAALQAMKDAGIERVRWNTQDDSKVCGDCDERHGVIYPIDSVPRKPHLGCRCYLTPVR